MITAYDLSMAGDKYIGTPYSTMDCQAFVEQCLADIGIKMDLSGSNAWFRKCTWRGTPEECKARFGSIPKGAFLFIWDDKGGERARGYYDGLGDATHIGIYTGRGKGAINSSYTNKKVCESSFAGKSINGGWNRVGLWDRLSYGDTIDQLLTGSGGGGGQPVKRARVTASKYSTVNLRKAASKSADVLVQVPIGSDVDVLDEEQAGWARVQWKSYTGYMMTEFLTPIPDEPGEIPPEETDPVPPDAPPEEAEPENPYDQEDTVQITMGQVEQLRQIAQDLLEWADGVIGHG